MRLILCLFYALLLSGVTQASAPYIYDGGFGMLIVGSHHLNETMHFPEDMATEVRRQYALVGVRRGRRYIIHMSYLGSPSIQYSIHVSRLPRPVVEQQVLGIGKQHEEHIPGRRQLSDVAGLTFDARLEEPLFAYVDGEGTVDNGYVDAALDDYVPVVEVRGKRNAFPARPERWRRFSYNIRVDMVGDGEGLDRVVAAHVAIVIAMIAGALLFVPRLITAIAGNAPTPRPRRDFILFLLER
ncbi:hypothetical protein DQ04_04951090 [Trypanosoma grayi]|uniref:hypothetical protein n=1 Tax=Trypanosoma grayi TaxID=71804 RepID=UPI0004F49020|nr:hypothetical protein DQ04_04951090 [Trypanosoma grayi]KEG09614.1 hypothetical protein DQ04_04951090 [Trypanosoma grayi]